ncbi:MAG: HtaA domain-containing protein [Actinobacteria bacterium]|nr:HtaA domain-containing protein [Actinomycetota bacterium]
MSMSPSVTSGRGRTTIRIAAVAALALVLTACNGVWGIRGSYRNYVAGPIGQGEIVPIEGAGWEEGDGAGQGPFTWTFESATYDEGTATGTVRMGGGVETRAHRNADGVWLLDTTFRNPRLEIDGTTAVLYADLNFRPFLGTDPDPLPNLQAATNVAFATVDLSEQDLTPGAKGWRHIRNAPMVGVQSTMELIGWDAFYGNPVTLDPLSISFTERAPAPAATASITVSETEGLAPGDQITVWGEGFDPNAHTGVRPPLAGQPSGAYVVFGRFADVWQPSQGAPSSARSVISQIWALPEAQHLALDPTQTSPSFVRISPEGTFTAVLTVGTSTATGNDGVYTYPGSGAVDATQEVAQLVTVVG